MPAYYLQSDGKRPVISAVQIEGFKTLCGPIDAPNFAAAKALFRKEAPQGFAETVAAASPVAEHPEEPIFKSMHEALTFAFRFAHDQFPRTPMTLLMRDGKLGSGRGLVGVNGAGEAGSVLGHVLRLPHPAERAAMIARFSVPVECPCCKAPAASEDYSLAIEHLAQFVQPALAGAPQNLKLRRMMVGRYFGSRMKMSEVSESCGVHRDTANEHYRKIKPVLAQLEQRAMERLERACERMLQIDA